VKADERGVVMSPVELDDSEVHSSTPQSAVQIDLAAAEGAKPHPFSLFQRPRAYGFEVSQ
jgi:hypothetical protein